MNDVSPALVSSMKCHKILESFLTYGLCLIPVIAVLSPRFLAFMPAVLVLIGIFPYYKIYNRWPLFSKSLLFWMSGITGLFMLSVFWGIAGTDIPGEAARAAFVLFSGVWLLAMSDAFSKEKLMRFFPICFLLAAILCLFDLYGDGLIYRLLRKEHIEHLNLSSLNRGVVALGFMAFPAMMAVWKSGLQSNARYGLILAVLLLTGAILYKTESQSAQLGFFISLLFFIVFPYGWRAAWIGLASLIGAAVMIAPFLVQWMFSSLAVAAKSTPWLARGYAADRMEIWDFVSRKALESPIFGFGMEATKKIQHFETRNLYTPLDHVLHPHNAILQIWIEFGAVGAVVAAGFLLYIFRSLYKLDFVAQRFALAVFMAVMAESAISYGLWQGWWLGLFVLLAVYFQVITKEKKCAPQ